MFDHVLVGDDGSPSGEDAVALARALAGATGARLTVGPSPASSLVRAAVEMGADLLVTGATPRGRFGHATAAATAERLLHETRCAVAVAPPGLAARADVSLRRIAVAYVATDEGADVVAAAHALAARTGGELTVITAFAGPAEIHEGYGPLKKAGDVAVDARSVALADLDDAIAALPPGVAVHTELIDGDPADVILERAAAFDVLVMGTRGNAGLRRMILGSVAHEVLADTPPPVLIVPRGVRAPTAEPAPGAAGAAG